MSRVSTFLRKVFRSTAVLGKVLAYAAPLVLADVKMGRAKTDAEIRESAKRHITDFLSARYPGYDFLIARAVDEVVDIIRAVIKKHNVN